MSLRDTLSGAREEIEASRSGANDKPVNAAAAKMVSDEPAVGMTKRSVSRAKPTRDASQGVRVVASSGSKRDTSAANKANKNMTREQRRAARAEEDRNRDRYITATNILLGKDPVYRRRRTIWWVMVIVGLVMTAASFVTIYVSPAGTANDFSTIYGILSFVALILAYVGILGALIYDFARIRPLRKQMEERSRSLSYKRLDAIIKEDIVERRAKKGRGKKASE